MPVRRPFIGELVTVESPTDPTFTFDLKRCGVNENIKRMNLASTMRYVEQAESGKVITERDYPMGSMRVDTVMLALAGWNITNDAGSPIPITRETVQAYLDPKEFDFLYDKIIEINPMWGSGGEEETKNA